MTRSVRILAAASDELLAAARWYEERTPGLGVSFWHAINSAMSQIEGHPEIGVPFLAKTRRVLVRGFPYHVIYYLKPSQTVVVAVAHTRRHPGFWKDRI